MLVKQRECSTMPGDVKSAFYVRGRGGTWRVGDLLSSGPQLPLVLAEWSCCV